MEGLSFDQLSANVSMIEEVKNQIQAHVLEAITDDSIKEEHVTIELQRGSVVALVTVIPPRGVATADVASGLTPNRQQDILTGIEKSIVAMPGISEVLTGSISAAVARPIEVTEIASLDDVNASEGLNETDVTVAPGWGGVKPTPAQEKDTVADLVMILLLSSCFLSILFLCGMAGSTVRFKRRGALMDTQEEEDKSSKAESGESDRVPKAPENDLAANAMGVNPDEFFLENDSFMDCPIPQREGSFHIADISALAGARCEKMSL